MRKRGSLYRLQMVGNMGRVPRRHSGVIRPIAACSAAAVPFAGSTACPGAGRGPPCSGAAAGGGPGALLVSPPPRRSSPGRRSGGAPGQDGKALTGILRTRCAAQFTQYAAHESVSFFYPLFSSAEHPVQCPPHVHSRSATGAQFAAASTHLSEYSFAVSTS